MQTSTIPHNQPLCLNWTPHTLLKSQFPCTNSHSTTPHAHPTPHQPHRGSWAGPWNLMTSLSLPSWNSKPCCSPLAHSYHLHGNLTSSCFPIGFMEQDTQKGFPFSPHHPPPKKMMLSTGTWAKFSYLGFRVLWLRKYREPSSFLHSTLLSTPPRSGCFTSLLPTQKPTGNTCWAWKRLDWPTYKVGTHRKFLHPPLLPGERGKREQKYAPVKKTVGTFLVLSVRLLLPSTPSQGLGNSMPKGRNLNSYNRILLLFARYYFLHQRRHAKPGTTNPGSNFPSEGLTCYGNWSNFSHPSSKSSSHTGMLQELLTKLM